MENKENKKQYRITCYDNINEYDFSLASLSVKDIRELVLNIVIANNSGMARKNVSNIYFECDIKNNKAKIALEYDTLNRHVKRQYTVDEYGVVDHDYLGFASDCFRGTMREKYGMMYEDALVKKFGKEAVALD